MAFFSEHDCGIDEKRWIEKGFAGLGLIAGLGVVVEKGGRKVGGVAFLPSIIAASKGKDMLKLGLLV